MEKISVIVPVYNTEKYIGKCIQSLVNQKYPCLEIILVNDGSTDGSLAVCNEFAKADDRIVVLNQKNGGVSAARNNGLEHATGQWVSFLDSDDWLDEDAFSFAMQAQREKNPDVVMWNRTEDYPDRQVVCRFADDTYYACGEEQMQSFRYRAFTCYSEKGVQEIGTANIIARIIRRAVIEDNGLRFQETLKNNEDTLFMLELFEHVNSVYLENRFYYHRAMREDSAIQKYNPGIIENNRRTSERYFDFLDRHNKSQKYYDFCGGLHVFWAMQCYSLCIFHKDNPDNFVKKLGKFRELISQEPFSTVFGRKPGGIVAAKKVYFFLAKHRLMLSLILFTELYKKVK